MLAEGLPMADHPTHQKVTCTVGAQTDFVAVLYRRERP
jgi:hypothetical protein